jgi:sRNA-binding protein
MEQDHNDVIDILAELYPGAFFMDQRLRQPLKKNILADIKAEQHPKLEGWNVGAAVWFYCNSYHYHKAVALAGSRRLDLNGDSVDTVTEKEAQSAIAMINEINAKKTARG